VNTKLHIYYGAGSLKSLATFLNKNHFTRIFILSDTNVLTHCYPILVSKISALQRAEIIEMEGGEENKNIYTTIQVWEALTELGADKNSLVINLGGGVITDLGGYAAASFKRGIPFIHIPTSLMAMADAAIGGKCGIDLHHVKNQIGCIIQPVGIFIYPEFLYTLPQQQLKNGLAEIIKSALIADAELIQTLIHKNNTLEFALKKSIDIKSRVVLKDPDEKNIRKTLNFGHSLGHAIESTFLGTKKMLLHGEAVAIGMLMEAHISFQKKMITKDILKIVESLITPTFKLPKFSIKESKAIHNYLAHDKKNINAQILMSLLNGLGKCSINVPVNEREINRSFAYYQKLSIP